MHNLPNFFIRRFDSHKFEQLIYRYAYQIYFDTNSKKEFKVELAFTAIRIFLKVHCNIDPNKNMTKEDVSEIINFTIDNYGPLMDVYYRNIKNGDQ
jgi:hypothetical protein